MLAKLLVSAVQFWGLFLPPTPHLLSLFRGEAISQAVHSIINTNGRDTIGNLSESILPHTTLHCLWNYSIFICLENRHKNSDSNSPWYILF